MSDNKYPELTNEDLNKIERVWLQQCGVHDFGVMEYGCSCADGDFRSPMLSLLAEVRTLRSQLKDYDALFTLQFTRMTEATALWRAEDPEARKMIMPDLGELLKWLMDRGHFNTEPKE